MVHRRRGCAWFARIHAFQQRNLRGLRPQPFYFGGDRGVKAENARGRGILHHRDEFSGSLAGVERDHDYAFGHQGQVQRGPANAVWGQQGAAIAFFQTAGLQKVAGLLGDGEQFAAGDGVNFFAVNFLEHRFGGGFLQLGENIF